MAKESSEWEFLKKKMGRSKQEKDSNLDKANIKEKVIRSDQLELLPIFPYSECLISMLPAPNVTDHSYFDSVYLKILTALSVWAN